MMRQQTLTALARKLGARLSVHRDRENLEHEITADAPDGKVWTAAGVHQLVCSGADGTTMDELREDMYERMQYGTEPCADTDCDVCHLEGEA